MIRLFGALLLAFVAISPIGVYFAASADASPPGGSGQCSFVLSPPKVVSLSGTNYVTATADVAACTLHAHTETTVCISVEGSDSAGQCATEYTPNAPVAYYPYRPGATYVAKGQGCTDIMEGTASPASPSTVCQDISPTRATL